jgi:putative flippase GtrA
MDAVPLKRQVALAESYIVEAQRQTLVAARATLWVLIAGCAACALAATAIIGVLPPFVMSGAWTYEAYQQAALIVVIGTAAGGVAVGVGLTVWLSRVVLRMNCNETCSAAHSVVAAVQSSGISAELAHELATGAYPRLGRLIAHVRH